MGRSSSVSGETLHLPNLRPGELEGEGINRCCFQGRAGANWLTWPASSVGPRHSWEGRGFCLLLFGLEGKYVGRLGQQKERMLSLCPGLSPNPLPRNPAAPNL